MKALKIIAPILLALVIALCLLFSFLSILNAPLSIWYQNELERDVQEWFDSIIGKSTPRSSESLTNENVYFEQITDDYEHYGSGIVVHPNVTVEPIYVSKPMFEVVVPQNGQISLLGHVLGGSSNALINAIDLCLVPTVITFISAIILALYFILLKRKATISPSGKSGTVAKIFSIIANSIGILASILICINSILNLFLCIKSFIDALSYEFAFWPGLIVALVKLLSSFVNVGIYSVLTLSLIVFLVITIKSKRTAVQTKKCLPSLGFLSFFGAAASFFTSLLSLILGILGFAIACSNGYFSLSNMLNSIIALISYFYLPTLLASIGIGFMITFLKVIVSSKKSKSSEICASDFDETLTLDTHEQQVYKSKKSSYKITFEENDII